MTKESIDDYHNNLMNDWLKYMSCWSLKPEPLETPKENVEGEKKSPKHKNKPTPQYFYYSSTPQYLYDISTNLFIPTSDFS